MSNPVELLERQVELLREVSNQQQTNLKLVDDLISLVEDQQLQLRIISRSARLYFWFTVVSIIVSVFPLAVFIFLLVKGVVQLSRFGIQ